MKSAAKYFCMSLIIMFVLSAVAFASGYDEYFVTANWLKQNQNTGLVILDARGAKAYKYGHIPGALPVSWKQLSDMTPEFAHHNWGTVTDKNILSDALSNLGITAQSKVIVYADTQKGWGEDGRIFWTLKISGLTDIRILDGGIGYWEKTGGPLSRKRPVIEKSNFKVESLNLKKAINTSDLIADYNRYKIIDTRSNDEFNGAVKYGEKRGGHLPNAIHLPYRALINDKGLLKSSREINGILKQKNLQTTDRIVTYCTAGIRSAHVQVVLEMLGYNQVQNYDESFYVWAMDNRTPIGKVIKQKTYNFISAAQLNYKIENNLPVTILDIQPNDDFVEHHIKDAIKTAAYPVKTDEEKERLNAVLPALKTSTLDIVVVCPRGGGGARRTVNFLKQAGILPSRLFILEQGQSGWPFPWGPFNR